MKSALPVFSIFVQFDLDIEQSENSTQFTQQQAIKLLVKILKEFIQCQGQETEDDNSIDDNFILKECQHLFQFFLNHGWIQLCPTKKRSLFHSTNYYHCDLRKAEQTTKEVTPKYKTNLRISTADRVLENSFDSPMGDSPSTPTFAKHSLIQKETDLSNIYERDKHNTIEQAIEDQRTFKAFYDFLSDANKFHKHEYILLDFVVEMKHLSQFLNSISKQTPISVIHRKFQLEMERFVHSKCTPLVSDVIRTILFDKYDIEEIENQTEWDFKWESETLSEYQHLSHDLLKQVMSTLLELKYFEQFRSYLSAAFLLEKMADVI